MSFKIRNCRAGAALTVGLGAAICCNANAELVYGISDELNQIVTFDSSNPGALKSAIALTGLASGEQIRGLSWVNGVLYGLGDENHLYTINAGTGFCSPVGLGSFSPVLDGVDFGLTAGSSLMYVSSDLGQNLSLNPNTLATTVLPNYTGASIDSLSYDSGNGLFYGVSAATHDLYSVNPATGGTSLIGPSGVDFLGRVGLDISPSGAAYFSGTVGGQTEFFDVNLATGAFSLVGDIDIPGDLNSGLEAIAANGITTVPEPTSVAFLGIAGGLGLLLMRRRR
jgi:hypothetical protein